MLSFKNIIRKYFELQGNLFQHGVNKYQDVIAKINIIKQMSIFQKMSNNSKTVHLKSKTLLANWH